MTTGIAIAAPVPMAVSIGTPQCSIQGTVRNVPPADTRPQTMPMASPIAIPVVIVGTVGYVITGWHAADLPPHSFGFVYLPALAALVLASGPMATAGAHIAHGLPAVALKRIFALLLFALATRMVVHYG